MVVNLVCGLEINNSLQEISKLTTLILLSILDGIGDGLSKISVLTIADLVLISVQVAHLPNKLVVLLFLMLLLKIHQLLLELQQTQVHNQRPVDL